MQDSQSDPQIDPQIVAAELFREALTLPREQRSAFLDGACRSTPAVRPLVEQLLTKHDRDSTLAPGSTSSPDLPRSLPPGTRLGRYSILEKLGAGGMGVVYRARDEKLERSVAIKVLAAGMLSGEEAHRHFRREALALAKLNHPNIAAVYDVGDEEGLSYIVMELVQGQPLSNRLQTGALSLREATAILLEISEALEEAHEQGVIHRDLKPANVMITSKGHAKVLDFGLAKLLAGTDAAMSLVETQGLVGTPLYMSPEQAMGKKLDGRTDIWSLGTLYYETLTRQPPFLAEGGLAVLRAITEEPLRPLRDLRPDAPRQSQHIVARALEKDPAQRYQSAGEMARDARALLHDIDAQANGQVAEAPRTRVPAWLWITIAAALIAIAAVGSWQYRQMSNRRWAREDAMPEISRLIDARKRLAAFDVLNKAQSYLHNDPQLQAFAKDNARPVSITSEPVGAQVEIQDYLAPDDPWHNLGTTPIANLSIPKGYFRWKVTRPGMAPIVSAPETSSEMHFPLTAAQQAPAGMVYDPGGRWSDYVGFLGWIGPYDLPSYYIDKNEVTNLEYQRFVDSGGYSKPQFWPATFQQNGHSIPWADAMPQFRDATGRPGPSTWSGGHYAEGKGQFPVSGVSWFEAEAYARFAGKSLPVLSQWYQAAPPDLAPYSVSVSNISGTALAAVGTFNGVGPDGTNDMAGNVREWTHNIVDDNLRFILGGYWKSIAYLANNPEALSPYDRSEGNGFRCVQNLAPVPEQASQPYHSLTRDFASYKPVKDEVFNAYKLLYSYGKSPLNAKSEGIVKETADWREEKISFDTAYNGERMSAYLFLPKRVQPPYQTVLFFPSARVYFLPPDSSNLGDTEFFDYIVQSGRAVLYPIYEDMYERRLKHNLPGGDQSIQLTSDWYKDAARSLDYLNTRKDIDSSRLAYLGVSMGAADGIIISTLLQDRLKTAIYLDGGYFLAPAPPGGDQADYAPRMKKPVLMVNGRYDFTFSVDRAQDPMFKMLGTPPDDKSHVILDTPHDVNQQRPQLVKTVLDWLDKYMEPVGR